LRLDYDIHQGDAVSQGDVSMRAAEARNRFGITGAGMSVGVISDGFDFNGGAGGEA